MDTQFETWWENESNTDLTTKELCRIAWENGAYCGHERAATLLNIAVNYNVITENGPAFSQELYDAQAKAVERFVKVYPDLRFAYKVDNDDFNEPLGPACKLGDETCESCQ